MRSQIFGNVFTMVVIQQMLNANYNCTSGTVHLLFPT